MKPQSNTLGWTVFVLLVSTAALSFYLEYRLYPYRHRVLTIPLSSSEEYSAPIPFTVHMHSSYVIGFTVRKERPAFDIVRPIPPDDCFVEFRIRSNGRFIAEGNNTLEEQGVAYGHGTIYRSIGRFDASPHTMYEFSFRVSQISPDMKFEHATISISLDPVLQEEVFRKMLLLRYLTLAFGGLTVIVAVFPACNEWRHRSPGKGQGQS